MIDALLSRLERVKQTGPNSWIASTPTRKDRHPSMTIKLLSDGRVLLHDFGGDSTEEILGAMGLDWSALFPERTEYQGKPTRKPFIPSDVFEVARLDVGVVAVIAGDMVRGRTIPVVDYDRLQVAAERLADIARAAYAARG